MAATILSPQAVTWGEYLVEAAARARLDRPAIANNTRTSDKTVKAWERGEALPTKPEYQRLCLSIPAMKRMRPPWTEADEDEHDALSDEEPAPRAAPAVAPPPPVVETDPDPVLTAALAYTDARHALDALDARVAAARREVAEAQAELDRACVALTLAEGVERQALEKLGARAAKA